MYEDKSPGLFLLNGRACRRCSSNTSGQIPARPQQLTSKTWNERLILISLDFRSLEYPFLSDW